MRSTQQAYPRRAAVRTAAQNIVSAILALGVVLPLAVQIVGDELGDWIPGPVLVWLVGAAAFMAALAAALARIMAIPQVDAWLQRWGLSSVPVTPAALEREAAEQAAGNDLGAWPYVEPEAGVYLALSTAEADAAREARGWLEKAHPGHPLLPVIDRML